MSSSVSTTSITTSIRHTSLTPGETDLWELCYYAGIMVDPQVFRILVDLLRMDVHPKAIIEVLKGMISNSKYARSPDQSQNGGTVKEKPSARKQPDIIGVSKAPNKHDKMTATVLKKRSGKQAAPSACSSETKSSSNVQPAADDKQSVSSTSTSSKTSSSSKTRMKVSSVKSDTNRT